MQRHPVPGGIGYGAWSELAQDGVWIFDSRIALQLKTGVRVKPRVVADMPTVESRLRDGYVVHHHGHGEHGVVDISGDVGHRGPTAT